jgi:hypothetical protein
VHSSGSTAISTFGPAFDTDLFPNEQHWRFIALAFADHHGALNRHLVEFAAHRVHRGLIGRFLIAVTAQPRRRHCGAFGHPHDLERQNTLQ